MIFVPNLFLTLKRPWIWLCRFRHRRGYGVHSPYAFDYITRVIYEHGTYYKYAPLHIEQCRLAAVKDWQWSHAESTKLKRLLFRIVNRAQPSNIVDVGPSTAAELYMRAAKEGADYRHATDLSGLSLECGTPVDFLYLHDYRHPALVREVFEACVDRTVENSAFVIGGIGYTRAMRHLWEALKGHQRVVVTFDLYDVGILLFDHSKNKQDYVVNFVNY